MRPHLADCTAFVLPTYYREGLPRTIMEAMAVGRPVIATDVTGCRDLVDPGVTGYLIPPRDVPALAEALLSTIEASDEALSANARRSAEARFSSAAVNAQIVESMDLAFRI